ncbi:Hypothetical predicted protein, partial [Paramuricea clavata]
MWEAMISCKKKSIACPVRGYYAITSNKLVHGVKLQTTFRDYYPLEPSNSGISYLDQVTQAVLKMATAPENYVPGMRSQCELTCYNVGPEEEVTIFSADNIGQVIQSLLIRVYDYNEGKYAISHHWERIFITMSWDGRESQVKDIPLSGLFTVGTGYLREVNGLMAGMRKKKCST